MAAAGDRIARMAPYVFIGRPLTGETRPDRMGRWYQSTVLQVVEVLRGAPGLVPGTVVVTDTAGSSPAHPPGQLPTAQELRGDIGHDGYEPGTWGVYFCRPSALLGPATQYRTDNRLRLRWYAADASANQRRLGVGARRVPTGNELGGARLGLCFRSRPLDVPRARGPPDAPPPGRGHISATHLVAGSGGAARAQLPDAADSRPACGCRAGTAIREASHGHASG